MGESVGKSSSPEPCAKCGAETELRRAGSPLLKCVDVVQENLGNPFRLAEHLTNDLKTK